MKRAILNDEEQKAMDALLEVMTTITRTWKMTANGPELASAVHTLQGFIIQHMLCRVEPDNWSSWVEVDATTAS